MNGYYGSTEFKVLAETTKATYRGVLGRFVDKHGEGPIAGLAFKRLKGLMDYAVSAGLRADNPVVVAKKVKLKTTGHRTWTEEDITKFRKHHQVGTPLQLAFEVLLQPAPFRCRAPWLAAPN
ncbi:hypothetical protein NLM27_42580 [Bradyrhizobium sp. CCGB12]|uniref:hypothetical protein n=1 Tax=Bradyrhizobium sp. CCGB12 TaxID=2949632 RepID=UPI0020B448BE|nr:hypothetical protein [Bradyrhizobium sp. CCGB12]MCP3395408.1 hypothetical protein [Bradyrhizobium sp. CCGB12]